MANAEDLNRLTSCSLVLLGHIFLSLGNARESMNMVTPAIQLASKIPDVHVQLWAAAILKGSEKRLYVPIVVVRITTTPRPFFRLVPPERPCPRAGGPPDARQFLSDAAQGPLPRLPATGARTHPMDGRPVPSRPGQTGLLHHVVVVCCGRVGDRVVLGGVGFHLRSSGFDAAAAFLN